MKSFISYLLIIASAVSTATARVVSNPNTPNFLEVGLCTDSGRCDTVKVVFDGTPTMTDNSMVVSVVSFNALRFQCTFLDMDGNTLTPANGPGSEGRIDPPQAVDSIVCVTRLNGIIQGRQQ